LQRERERGEREREREAEREMGREMVRCAGGEVLYILGL
jgi:hypothetical protein